MINHAKPLGLSELHELSTDDKLNFLRSQIQESRKIIWRHLVELNTADSIIKDAQKRKDETARENLLQLAGQRQREGKESIAQIKINIDSCYELYLELGGDPDEVNGKTEDWRG